MTGRSLEPYQGNPSAPELSIWSPAPEIPPETLDPTYIPDDEEARTRSGPTHGFDPPVPDASNIVAMIENGQITLIAGNYQPRQPAKFKKRRNKKVIGGVAAVSVLGLGAVGYKIATSLMEPDLCVTSQMNFPNNVDISSIELCIPSDGVHLDSDSGRITAQVDTHYNMRNGTAAPNTIGELAVILQASQQPSADIARQPAAYATSMLVSVLARSDGGAPLCQEDISSVIAKLRDEAGHFTDNQLVAEGVQPLSAGQIRGATDIRLVSRYDVAGEGNDEGRDIVCS